MASKSVKSIRAELPESSMSGVIAAQIAALGEDGVVGVRSAHAGSMTATLTRLPGYRPSVGDRVLVAEADGERFVIAVVAAAAPPSIALADGTRAEVAGEAIELRNAEGRLLVRYADGAAEIAAPEGDLKLSAPRGRVVLSAATDVELEATRDLVQRAGRSIELGVESEKPQITVDAATVHIGTKKLRIEAKTSRATIGDATLIARRITTSAEQIAQRFVKYELEATKIVERAKESFRDVADLAQTRVGRARTIVKDVYSLYSRRTVMVSKDDTSVDGKKILLG